METLGFPGGSDGKESACNAGDPGSIPGLGRSPGEGHNNPFQYSCLENSMDRRAFHAIVHAVTNSPTRLSDFTFHSQVVLRFPWWLVAKEFGCQYRRCGFNLWVMKIPWRRKWKTTPVSLPGKSHGQRSLVGCSP